MLKGKKKLSGCFFSQSVKPKMTGKKKQETTNVTTESKYDSDEPKWLSQYCYARCLTWCKEESGFWRAGLLGNLYGTWPDTFSQGGGGRVHWESSTVNITTSLAGILCNKILLAVIQRCCTKIELLKLRCQPLLLDYWENYRKWVKSPIELGLQTFCVQFNVSMSKHGD